MSLDVKVKYKSPVMERYGETHACCGSTSLYGGDVAEEVGGWNANITHNMGEMSDHILVEYQVDGETYTNTLYQMVWRPEEVGIGGCCCNTTVMAQALQSGIAYMVSNRAELEKFNPKNGWGGYDAFLNWLIAYWNVCLRHPDCKIEVDR